MSIDSMNSGRSGPAQDRRKRRWLRWLLIAVPVMLLLAGGGFVVWASSPPPPLPEALNALESGEGITVSSEGWLVFQPAAESASTGLIIYPGGRVDARAYAPLARAIAAEGYLVVITPMPLNLAFFNPYQANEVIAAYPEIEHWAVGGHSLGGAMAARFVSDTPNAVEGLALWASYPDGSNDLAESAVAVVSIYGTLDGLATLEKIDASRPLLPPDTTWVAIEGGNHAQFGWYGDQAGDNPAAISREAQQSEIIAATAALLERL